MFEALLHLEQPEQSVDWLQQEAGGILADGSAVPRHNAGVCPNSVYGPQHHTTVISSCKQVQRNSKSVYLQGLFEWLKSAELRSTEEFMVGTDLESVKGQLCDLKVSFCLYLSAIMSAQFNDGVLERYCLLVCVWDLPKQNIISLFGMVYCLCFLRDSSENFTRRKSRSKAWTTALCAGSHPARSVRALSHPCVTSGSAGTAWSQKLLADRWGCKEFPLFRNKNC